MNPEDKRLSQHTSGYEAQKRRTSLVGADEYIGGPAVANVAEKTVQVLVPSIRSLVLKSYIKACGDLLRQAAASFMHEELNMKSL